MAKKQTAFIVEDDAVAAKKLEKMLLGIGFEVHCYFDSSRVVEDVNTLRPDLVILDILMPGIDGLEITRRLRKFYNHEDLKIAVVSSKTYETDRRRAMDLGADIFISKPFDKMALEDIKVLMSEKSAILHFWGVRGTLPVPGTDSVEYGGNTSCVTVELSNDQLIIFDAGSGAKNLADALMKKGQPVKADYYISHAHWDHINGLPFFTPLYIPGNTVNMFGPVNQEITFKDMISGQMDSIYFPITIETFAAHIGYYDLREETKVFSNYKMHTKLLNHPGNCLGYRIEYDDISIAYVTDNELRNKGEADFDEAEYRRLVNFVHRADVLITDSTYTAEEYKTKKGWGHSTVDQVCHLAHDARVKNLFLFHHDPDQKDDDITSKHETANSLLKKLSSKTKCYCPAEGDAFEVKAKSIQPKAKKSAA